MLLLLCGFVNLGNCAQFQKIGLKRWDTSALCNDGTQAALYYTAGYDLATVIVYFQGGFQCYSQASCDKRFTDSPSLMSSKDYPQKLTINGILSQERTKNKAFFNASKIYLPYCSSDVFVGNFSSWGYQFRGQHIVGAVMQALSHLHPAMHQLYIAGGSAGARAALFNIQAFQDYFPKASVRGIFDSPIWLDIMPRYDTWPGTLGIAMLMEQKFNFKLKDSCLAVHSSAPYKCFITQYYLQFITQPFFLASSVYDAFIIPMFVQDHPPFNYTSTSLSYNIRTLILTQLKLFQQWDNRTGIFSLACYEHSTSLSDQFWGSKTDIGESMNDAIWRWLATGYYVSMDECVGFACGKNCMKQDMSF